MWGMRGMGSHTSTAQRDARQEVLPAAAAERIARLEQEVADLRTQLRMRDGGQDQPVWPPASG